MCGDGASSSVLLLDRSCTEEVLVDGDGNGKRDVSESTGFAKGIARADSNKAPPIIQEKALIMLDISELYVVWKLCDIVASQNIAMEYSARR